MKTSKRCSRNVGFEYHFYSVWTWIQKQSLIAKQKNLWWDPRFFGFEYRKLNSNGGTKHALILPKIKEHFNNPSLLRGMKLVDFPNISFMKNVKIIINFTTKTYEMKMSEFFFFFFCVFSNVSVCKTNIITFVIFLTYIYSACLFAQWLDPCVQDY